MDKITIVKGILYFMSGFFVGTVGCILIENIVSFVKCKVKHIVWRFS